MRNCGDCTLCCKLLPVKELAKGANERCRHQRFGACKVYKSIEMPMSCKVWNCRWLVSDDTLDLPRPDRSHYVVDIMPDFITMNSPGKTARMPVVQIWVDPAFPKAYLDRRLLAYVERRALEGVGALIRYDNKAAFTLWAPHFTGDGWQELTGEVEPQHSSASILETTR